MKRLPLAVAAAAGLALAGCHSSGSTPAASSPSRVASAPSSTPSSAPSSAAVGKPVVSASAGGSLPDICTLLSKAEVTALTGQPVTLTTKDDGTVTTARYCQWQLGVGQLTVTVSVESRESFDTRNAQSAKVDGIGAAAYSLSGHLFVYAAGRDVDVYDSSADSDAADLTVEKHTVTTILPRLAG